MKILIFVSLINQISFAEINTIRLPGYKSKRTIASEETQTSSGQKTESQKQIKNFSVTLRKIK